MSHLLSEGLTEELYAISEELDYMDPDEFEAFIEENHAEFLPLIGLAAKLAPMAIRLAGKGVKKWRQRRQRRSPYRQGPSPYRSYRQPYPQSSYRRSY
jgi:hypothetical protein